MYPSVRVVHTILQPNREYSSLSALWQIAAKTNFRPQSLVEKEVALLAPLKKLFGTAVAI
jgi:hypothetical protein